MLCKAVVSIYLLYNMVYGIVLHSFVQWTLIVEDTK